MLSAPPFVVVTIKFPLALVLKPYTSGEDAFAKLKLPEPSVFKNSPALPSSGRM